MSSCTLRVAAENTDEGRNFLVTFSNGSLLQPSQPKITLYNKSPKEKKRRLLVAETNDMAYVGNNFDSSLRSSCQYCIGALDKETGVMTLHKAEFVTLKPHIPGFDGFVVYLIWWKKIPASQPKREKIIARISPKWNKLDGERLEETLEPAFSHVESKVEEAASLNEPTVQGSGLIPPHNVTASSPQDVYNINDIVSIDELAMLKATAQVFSQATLDKLAQWKTEKRYPEYVLQHIILLPPEPHRDLKAAILLYASFLIQIYNMKHKTVMREGLKFDAVTPPEKVLQQLQSKFTEKQEGTKKPRIVLSSRMKDKVCLYLLVLCLFIDDFSVEFLALQKDLMISKSKLKDHFRALGCTVKQTGRKRSAAATDDVGTDSPPMIATLKAPPNFPKPRVGRKKKDLL